MNGIYVHIPFCKKRCTYCNFYSTVNTYNIDDYVTAICTEAKNRLNIDKFETLYFGGGTPSLLSKEQINRIYHTLASNYNLTNLKEFTIECNPDDITTDFISNIQQTKVNRISIGVQSFDNKILTFINRRHDAAKAKDAVSNLQKAGYKNISIDLIYGIPGQTLESWTETVNQALALKVQHISAYNLSFEEGTKMFNYKKDSPSDELCLEMYNTLCRMLESEGFEHYEISNFALEGFRSKHNSIYWNGGEYIGLGAGAHSYNGKIRCWNKPIQQKENTLFWESESEILTSQDKYNDTIVTALRTKDGINIDRIEPAYQASFIQKAHKLEKRGLIKLEGNCVSLTKNGIFVSDSVMRDFIEV
ncbi:MAG: radical SAM family heme chaperone HemW [Paludibacteraceae bacterium]|nr:radical SAM family heme chaperone HemW [Paludibacteraceae bacterium]